MITPAAILLIAALAVLCVIVLAATERPAPRVRVEVAYEIVFVPPKLGRERLN